jgi:transposase
MVSKNQPFVIQWKERFKETLKDREMSISEISEILSVRCETVSRWVNYFEMEGLLISRFNGLKRMVSLNGVSSE